MNLILTSTLLVSPFILKSVNDNFNTTSYDLSFSWMLLLIATIILIVLAYVSIRKYISIYKLKRRRDKR